MRQGEDPATYPARAIAALEKARGDGSDIGLDLRARPPLSPDERASPRPCRSSAGWSRVSRRWSTPPSSCRHAQEGAGQSEQAVATLEKALTENPSSFRAQLRLAEVYEQDEQWNEAADALARAQALNPRAPMIARRRAVALLSAGRGAGGARPPAGVDGLAGRMPTARTRSCSTCWPRVSASSKDLDAAQATAQKLIAANPEDVRGLHVLSLILQDKGDVKGAERALGT